MRTFTWFVAACMGMVLSCKKDTVNTPATVKALAGNWSIVSFTETAEGEADKDLLSAWDDCVTDNMYVMKEDQTYMQKDLGRLCSDTGNNYVGVWELHDNMLSFDKFTGQIETLSNQQLVMRYEYSIMGVNTLRRAVFTKR